MRYLWGVKTILRTRPKILFEFGLGASDFYNIRPADMHEFICNTLHMKIYTLKGWLSNSDPLSLELLESLYLSGKEYYFIAVPA
jgi:hypothetical protein